MSNGASMDELRALVAKWREAGDQARNKVVDVIFNGCANELESLLHSTEPAREQPVPAEGAQAAGLAWNGPQGHLARCKFASGIGYCNCGWLTWCNRNRLTPPATAAPAEPPK